MYPIPPRSTPPRPRLHNTRTILQTKNNIQHYKKFKILLWAQQSHLTSCFAYSTEICLPKRQPKMSRVMSLLSDEFERIWRWDVSDCQTLARARCSISWLNRVRLRRIILSVRSNQMRRDVPCQILDMWVLTVADISRGRTVLLEWFYELEAVITSANVFVNTWMRLELSPNLIKKSWILDIYHNTWRALTITHRISSAICGSHRLCIQLICKWPILQGSLKVPLKAKVWAMRSSHTFKPWMECSTLFVPSITTRFCTLTIPSTLWGIWASLLSLLLDLDKDDRVNAVGGGV